ncbi:hypothetical protein H1R20_g11009, partial [Candolleomyces eurysporus]
MLGVAFLTSAIVSDSEVPSVDSRRDSMISDNPDCSARRLDGGGWSNYQTSETLWGPQDGLNVRQRSAVPSDIGTYSANDGFKRNLSPRQDQGAVRTPAAPTNNHRDIPGSVFNDVDFTPSSVERLGKIVEDGHITTPMKPAPVVIGRPGPAITVRDVPTAVCPLPKPQVSKKSPPLGGGKESLTQRLHDPGILDETSKSVRTSPNNAIKIISHLKSNSNPHQSPAETLESSSPQNMRPTKTEVHVQNMFSSGKGFASCRPRPPKETSSSESLLDSVANPAEVTPRWQRIGMDLAILLALLFTILWPWVFFWVVEAKKGLQMYGRLAETIDQYPQLVAIVVTLIGTINRLIATFLFGLTIVRLGQELIAASIRQEVTVFGVTALLAFRHMSMVWGIGQLRQMKNGRGRWAILALLLAALGAFALVPSGTVSLITPGQFNKTAELRGAELDFTSTDPGCLTWLEANRVVNKCDWTNFAGTQFTKCLGENQILDVLDSGRTNMLSVLGINNGTSSLDQLGGEGGIRFLGSPKGVLPIGPNGIPAFNTLVTESNPFVDDAIRRRMVSYNYTLNQQGLESRVTCSYENSSPIKYRNISNINTTRIISAFGTCDPGAGLEDVLEDVPEYVTLDTPNTLTFWACKQTPQPGSKDSTYFLYLRGRAKYATSIGNITCQISPVRARDYSVEYLSLPQYFTSEAIISVAAQPTTFNRHIEGPLIALGNIIWESQSWSTNVVAEAVFSLGAKNLNLPTLEQHPKYLSLFEKMIEGMLEYEVGLSRP